MTEVTRCPSWHQNFVPKGLLAPAPGLYTCIKSGKFVYKEIFISPEPKAHKVSLQYTNGLSLSSSTLSNLNISEAIWPILIKFYM